jgi:hypothetical protein
MDEEHQQDKRIVNRSPSSPIISLKRGLERAREFADAFKRNPGRVSDVVGHWGYKAKSSGGLQTIATLKSFGLIDEVGSGINRKIQLSELGRRALYDERPGGRETAIREAALKPKAMAEFWELWNVDRPPDGACISELTLERGFTDDAARRFLSVYDETISFANLTKDGIVSEREPDTMEDANIAQKEPITTGQSKTSAMVERLIDDSGSQIVLQFDKEPSAASYEYLRDYLDFKLKRIQSRDKTT